MDKSQSLYRRLMFGFLLGFAIGCGFLASGVVAVTLSAALNTFQKDQVLSATDMNKNFSILRTALEALPNWTRNGTAAEYVDGDVNITAGRVNWNVQYLTFSFRDQPTFTTIPGSAGAKFCALTGVTEDTIPNAHCWVQYSGGNWQYQTGTNNSLDQACAVMCFW